MKTAKAYVGAAIAIVGAGVTTAVGLVTLESPWFIPLTVVSAMLTAAGTYAGVWGTTNAE